MNLTKDQNGFQFLDKNITSSHTRCRKMTDQLYSSEKLKNLRDLKQILPTEALQKGIFQEILSKNAKIKSKLQMVQIEEIAPIQRSKLSISENKINSNDGNQKSPEKQLNKRNSDSITAIVQHKDRKTSLNNSSQQKSIISTNAGSEKSEKQNLSIGDISQQNQIIKINQNQNKQKIQEIQDLKIQDFQLLNFCGEGALGSVFVARHKKTNYLCALKKILKSSITCQQQKQSLIRQIKIHMKLKHPNIVKFYGCFSNQQAFYFVLQLCEQGNLYQMLQRYGTFHQKDARQIIRQVCGGIDYLHNQNIIHRDIKAQNIIVHDKVVKICDFGWATQGQYSRKSLCGTPAYISPEVVKSQHYDKKVDIWSLGVLAYELVFGKIPFDIKSQQDFQKIVNEELKFPQQINISDNCKDFIRKCLQKNSFKRWDTSRLLAHPFLKRQ